MVIARLTPTDRDRTVARTVDTVPFPTVRPVDRAPVLSVAGLGHRYGGTTVLEDIGFEVARGEILCLVGPSGCGKSTCLRLIAGLEPIAIGAIAIGGETASAASVHRAAEGRNVGLMFQDYALFPHMSVLDNVAFGIRGKAKAERRAGALAALDEVGLVDYATAYPHILSGGQQQRVALARALAPGPALMLLDEPFSGLDRQLRNQVRDDTMHLLKRSGAATVLVTHDPEEAMFMADRIVVMRDGRIEQVGAPAEIYYRPASAFVTEFFSEVNRLPGRVVGGHVDTPLGQVAAGSLPEGSAAQVLVRPEGLKLNAAGHGPRARVMAARMLGRTSLVHLSLQGPGAEVHLHARVPGRFLPCDSQLLTLALDPEQTFVFPA
ncbi:MAG: ABC transporter ATP-binding protein [Alphaproteobacteria bacterium]